MLIFHKSQHVLVLSPYIPSGKPNIAMENGPFIDGLPIKNGGFP